VSVMERDTFRSGGKHILLRRFEYAEDIFKSFLGRLLMSWPVEPIINAKNPFTSVKFRGKSGMLKFADNRVLNQASFFH
jgi:hypothetical protein